MNYLAFAHAGPHYDQIFVTAPVLDTVIRGIALSAIGLTWIIVLVRLIGLRSFSKMTAFDFIVTVATGSLLATATSASEWLVFLQPLIAAAALLMLQYIVARFRKNSATFRDTIENDPVMLVHNGKFIDSALERTRVTRADVFAKLREANALDMSSVRAVILETTGDISVMHGSEIDPVIISGVSMPNDSTSG